MALDEHPVIERHAEAIAELVHPFGFVLAAAVGEKNEGYPLGLEILQGFLSTWERFGTAE